MKSPLATEIIELICVDSLFIIFTQRCETSPPFPFLILTPCAHVFSVVFSALAEVLCEVTEFTANENVHREQ